MGVYLFVHCVGIHIEARGQLVGIAFVVPLGWFQESNSGCQSWQASLFVELSCQPNKDLRSIWEVINYTTMAISR